MQLLEMSISAGVLIMLLVLFRAWGLQKMPKRMYVLLWIVVLFRLMLPGSLPIQGGIATPAVRLMRLIAQTAKQRLGLESGKAVAAVMPEAASSGITAGFGKSAGAGWTKEAAPVLFCIWIVGLVGFGIYFIHSYVKENRLLAQALPMESDERQQVQALSGTAQRIVGIRHKDKTKDRLFTHDQIVSPLVWGTVKQRIVFPKKMVHMEPGQMKYVLAHEMVHVRRRDNFWKLLSAVAVCIHWFNPMVWAMYFLFARDLELSCDERVIALYGSQSREEYAMALIALAENQNQAKKTLFCSGFGKNPMKERIVAVMKYKRLTGIGICCAAILMAGATTVFATNDKADVSERVEMVSDSELQESSTLPYTETKTQVVADSKLADEADGAQKAEKDVEYQIIEDESDADAAKNEYRLVAGENDMHVELDGGAEVTLNADIKEDGTVDYEFVDENGNSTSVNEAVKEGKVYIDGMEFFVEKMDSSDGGIHLSVTENRGETVK